MSVSPLPPLIRAGHTLYTAQALPDGERKGVILLVHGYAEHSGFYTHVIAALVGAGYAVYTIDHRGHGRSDGVRAYVESIQTLADDLYAYFQQVRALHPGEPITVYGHSMGALVGVLFALAHQDEIAGLISGGIPLMIDRGLPPLQIALIRVVGRLAPTAVVAPNGLSNVLSYDEEVERNVLRDPLRYHGRLRAGTIIAMIDGARWARTRLDTLRLPLFAYHGADDKLVYPGGTDLLCERASSVDQSKTHYEHMKHECHNEIDKARVLTDVIDWLDAHAVANSPRIENLEQAPV